MLKRIISGIMLTLLLASILTFLFNVHPVKSGDNLLLEMQVSKTTITVGESINITLTLKNTGTTSVKITFGPPFFDVYYCTHEGCFRWSADKYFIQVILDLILEPGETYAETLQWNLYKYVSGEYYPPELGTYVLFGVCYWVGLGDSVEVTVVERITATAAIHPYVLSSWSKGVWISAYIELPEGYNVNGINVSTTMLNDAVPVDLEAPTAIGDYDEDGILDLMIKFDRALVIDYIGDHVDWWNPERTKPLVYKVTLTVTGMLLDGTSFEGDSIIRILKFLKGYPTPK